MHRIFDYVEQKTAQGLAELDGTVAVAMPGGPVIEARIVDGEVVVDGPPASSKGKIAPARKRKMTKRKSNIPSEVLIIFARFEGRRACEADVSLDQNPYRGSAGQEYLADAWEDSWLDTVDILRETEA